MLNGHFVLFGGCFSCLLIVFISLLYGFSWLSIVLVIICFCGLLFIKSRTVVLATNKNKILVYRASNEKLASKKLLRDTIERKHSSVFPCFLEVDESIFLIKKIPLLCFSVWSFEECSKSVLSYSVKKILRSYPWPALLMSEDGKILFTNAIFAEELGCLSQDLDGVYFVDLFVTPPSRKQELCTKVHKLKGVNGKHVAMMISHMVSEGDIVVVFLFSANFTNSVLGSSDLFILSQVPLPAAFLDEHGGIQQANIIMREKLSAELPASLAKWISEKDRLNFSKQLKKLRKDPSSYGNFTLSFRNHENKRILVFLKYIARHDNEGPGEFLAIFTMEDYLLQVKDKEADPNKLQLLGQLASGIVHDFNNLLTGILGFCDLLLQRHSPQEASFKDIEQIKQSAMRAARLIQQLLAFSKASPPSKAPISLKKCLQDLFPLMRRMVGPKVSLMFQETSDTKFIIYGDSSQLEQILLNLAINARDAMVDGGTLTLDTRLEHVKQKLPVINNVLLPKRYIVVEVKDTGTGIEEQHIKRIFDPFFSTKDPGQGTGLGLSNVLQIMEVFHGGIRVDSKIGAGSTFSLYFPEYTGSAVSHNEKAIASATPDVCESIRILLVEDEDPVRLFAARALREKGHEVIEARDGTQALRFLQNNADIQVIVTDVMMPGVDGPSLAIAIKEIYPNMKILFVSGYPEEEVRSKLPASVKEIYFLSKPFALADLVNKIQQLFVL